jgi:WD40 repeat protein
METWKRREGNTMTVEGYRASGGIHGAVAQSAEHLYARIEPERRHVLRDLVLRLLVPGTEGQPMRSRVPRRLVGTDPEHDRLIELLVAARLVTVDDGALEITHESLARAWPRLRGWLDDDVEGRRILHHLSAAADAWDSLGRPPSELYRGVRLTRTLAWREEGDVSLTSTEEAFLAESRAQAEIEEQSAAERARAQARMIRRLRVVLIGGAALLILSIVAGGMAAVQSDRAQDSAAAAAGSETRALAGGAAARSAAVDDADTSLLLGVAGVALHESPETVGSLIGALSRHSSLARSVPLAGDDPRTLDVHPGGELVAVLDTHHHLRLLDLATGEEIADRQVGAARSETEENRPMRFSPDGRLLAVSSTALTDRPVVILDGRTLEPTAWQPTGLPRGDWQTIDLKFDQRSRSLVAVLNNMVRADDAYEAEATLAVVWTVDSRRPPRTVELPDSGGWGSAALSPDGSRLYTVAPDLLVHDLRTGSRRVLGTSDAIFGAVEVSPDGRLLAWGRSQLGDTLLVDARTGRRVHRLPLDGEQGGVRFSNDGRRVLTVIWHDRDAAVWDVASGNRLATLALAEGNSGAVDLDKTGTRIVSAAADGAIREWHVDGQTRYLERIPVDGLPWGRDGGACLTVPSTNGARVAYDECTDPNFRLDTLVMLDTESGKVTVQDQPGTESVGASGNWDRSARRFVQVVGDGLHVWDDGGRLLARRELDPDVGDAQFTPSGDRLVLSGTDGRVSMLDADTLEPVGIPVDVDGSAWAVPGYDDRHAFVTVGGTDRTFFWRNPTNRWALVDLEEGVVVRESEIDLEFPAAIALAADGQHAAIADNAGAVLIVDLTTGRPVRDPGQHRGGAGWLAFSSDGQRLATGGFDGTVVLWDVGTGKVLARIRVPRSVLTSPAFRPDGTILIVPWWRDPAVYVWDPSTERAVEFACRAAGRDLTEAEWRDHFGSLPYRTPCASLTE